MVFMVRTGQMFFNQNPDATYLPPATPEPPTTHPTADSATVTADSAVVTADA